MNDLERSYRRLLIVFLAAYLRDKRESLAQGRLKDLGPLLAISLYQRSTYRALRAMRLATGS